MILCMILCLILCLILCRCNWAHVWIGQLVLMNIRPVLDLYWYQHWTSPNVLLRYTILYESWIIHVFELWTSSHLIYVYQHWTFPHVLLRHTILYESSSFNGHSIHIYEHWTSPCATAVGHIFSVSNQILIIIIIWHIWIRECSSPSQQNIVTLFKYQNDECASVLAMMKTKEHISRPVLVNRSDGR